VGERSPHQIGQYALVDGPIVLRMFYDEAAESPLWDERGTMTGLDQLPLSDDLRSELSEWAKRAGLAQWNYVEDDSIRDQGLALCERTRREHGSRYRLNWRHD
jgi:hypothetical protein